MPIASASLIPGKTAGCRGTIYKPVSISMHEKLSMGTRTTVAPIGKGVGYNSKQNFVSKSLLMALNWLLCIWGSPEFFPTWFKARSWA